VLPIDRSIAAAKVDRSAFRRLHAGPGLGGGFLFCFGCGFFNFDICFRHFFFGATTNARQNCTIRVGMRCTSPRESLVFCFGFCLFFDF